ncbi:unnamed protein product [Nippostrongylus brasiliensis]|uniref:Protein kinase domain-containing protein n=1 Tax=Nippostrongylus brasiliensis TaxID=27835 RepID=A0A0N4XC76_NIPBR|nr:unnamed protein product [Nippostrongylus brasiliensis]
MGSETAVIHGVKISTNIGLWPYSEGGADGVRMWCGSLIIDATDADSDHSFKIRCACQKFYLSLFRCTRGSGRVKKGAVKHLGIKVPEPAIATAILTVLIDDVSTDLHIYRLDGAEELYFGTGDPEKLAMILRSPVRPKWQRREEDCAAFEVVSSLIKPFLESTSSHLSNYLTEPSQETTVWDRLNNLVYPVVLELLEDLGEFAKRESQAGRRCQAFSSERSSSEHVVNEVAELVLIRLSEKLRRKYGELDHHFDQEIYQDIRRHPIS